jgi:hypothetical protein
MPSGFMSRYRKGGIPMKKLFVAFAALPLLVFVTTQSLSKEKLRINASEDAGVKISQTVSDQPLNVQSVKRYAIADTFMLASYTFDSPAGADEEGWIHADRTVQTGCYFHVDDFSGLGGGESGLLVPLQGNQSLWCGARPDSGCTVLGGYATLPGYGNGWDQGWCFKCIGVPDTEAIAIDYLAAWDTEPEYDYWYIEYATKSICDSLQNVGDIGMGDWIQIVAVDDKSFKTPRSDTIPAGHGGAVKIRFRFLSDGAWSDQDGLYETDGALIVDSLTIHTPTILYDFEDFEDESPDDLATTDGDWECCVLPGFGDFAGLFHGTTVVQDGDCKKNLSYLWGFFRGSTETYACSGHPGQLAVPKGNHRGQFIHNEVWSPLIDWTQDMFGTPVPSSATSATLTFETYREGSRVGGSLVYDVWYVRSHVDGCPTEWRNDDFVTPYFNWDWIEIINPIENYIDPNASHIQVAVGAVDMCPAWCIIYGTDDCHSHTPLYDNVNVFRIDFRGPRWYVRDKHLFQDNFPSDGTVTGTVRIDMADDILPSANPSILPGDSAVVHIYDDDVGLDYHMTAVPSSGPAVYCHVRDIGPSKSGMAISGDPVRWPVASAGGGWTVLQMDTCFTSPGRLDPVSDKYCVDLNDNLFTSGDTVYFYYSARDIENNTTYWSQPLHTYEFEADARAGMMEMTCLPANGLNGATDILYVDDYNEYGAQPYFESAFDLLSITPDRYDVRASASLVGNSPGGRVTNVLQQLIPYYKKIIWNSGDLSIGTVGDGTDEKADDYALLFDFLDLHADTTGAGIYFSGDDLASDLHGMTSASSQQFKNVYMPHTLISFDHTDFHGINPLGAGAAAGSGVPPAIGVFDHGPPNGVDTIIVYGACPIINDFDVIAPAGTATQEMTYESDPTSSAIVAFDTLNSNGNRVATVLSGFSFHFIRDDRPAGIPDRADHLRDILVWLGNPIGDPTHADGELPAIENSLSQNYPNPFNPVTTIRYSIRQKGHVNLKVYNVAGQLVRTLINEIQNPRAEGYTVSWNGENNIGEFVSSGVYFYKLVAKNYSQTKKMVLLK